MEPIERLIDDSVKCVKCGVKGVGNCDCWSRHKTDPECIKHLKNLRCPGVSCDDIKCELY